MKIVFIGNCQAQALSQITHFLGLDVELEFVPLVFDIENFNTQQVKDKIYSCDFVFSQRVSEDYQVDFVRPSAIRASFGERALIWPNVYFDGYFPGVRYIYAPNGNKVTGPLTDYHFVQIQKMWAQGASPEEALERLIGPLPFEGLPADPVADSLFHLRHREQYADIQISDHIEKNYAHEKLFYSMNHPTDKLLLELLSKMFVKAGINTPVPEFHERLFYGYQYSLNEIDLPILPYISNRYGTPLSSTDRVNGRKIVLDNGRYVASNEKCSYSGVELVEAFYRVYDTADGMDAVLLQGYD